MRETCVKEKEIQPLEVERIVTYDNCASDEEKAERIKLDRALGTLDCIYTDLAANYNGEISILEDMVDKKSGEVCQLRAKLFQIRNDNGSIKVTRENVEEIEHELNTRENELAKAVYRLRDSSMKDFSLAYKRRQVNLNQYNWKKVYLTPDVVREELAKLAQEQEEANAELEALKARNQELRRQTQYLL